VRRLPLVVGLPNHEWVDATYWLLTTDY
jgi:hypothetical protein